MKDSIICYSVWCYKVVFWMKLVGMKYYFIKKFRKHTRIWEDLGGVSIRVAQEVI